MMEGSVFRGLDRSQNLLSDLDLGGPSNLRSDLQGHPRPKITKIVILPSLKDRHFYIIQGTHLRPLEAVTSIRPPRPFEAATLNQSL